MASARPWQELDLESCRVEELRAWLDQLPPRDRPRILSRLDETALERILTLLPAEEAAELLELLQDAQATEVIEELPRDTAAAILEELPSEDRADLLTGLDEEDAEEILAEMAPASAWGARRLARYPEGVAGAIMATEFVAFTEDVTVGEALTNLRRRADEVEDRAIQYVYVVSAERRLLGVLRLRELVLAPSGRPVGRLAVPDPITLNVSQPVDQVATLFDEHAFLGLPVVDRRGRLLGIVHRDAVEEALGERAESDYLKSQGIVGGEEFRTMSTWSRSRRRLSWLSVNILLNVLAASVIAFYQDTLSTVIALAVFLPIISDMSGCSGSQALAVSMRELSLGLVDSREVLYVLRKELLVGLVNGLVLGVLLAGVAWLWRGDPVLGLVVGGALAVNTLVAVSIGGSVPLVLKHLRLDPALASGPILTTFTDICGFLLILGAATLALPWLISA